MEELNYKKLVDNNLDIDPRAFANSVIEKCFRLGVDNLTNLKLQKILYYSYAFCCWNIEKIPFLPKDNITFYAFGPVFPAVYKELKIYGNNPIQKDTVTGYKNSFLKKEVVKNDFSLEYKAYGLNSKYKYEIIKSIQCLIIIFINEDIQKLTRYTHSKNSAWNKIYKSNKVIDNKEILKYIIEDLFDIKLVSEAKTEPIEVKVKKI